MRGLRNLIFLGITAFFCFGDDEVTHNSFVEPASSKIADSMALVAEQASSNIFDNILNPGVIARQIVSDHFLHPQEPTSLPAVLVTSPPPVFNNHLCLKDTALEVRVRDKVIGSLSKNTLLHDRKSILNAFGIPTQKTFCTSCPVWQYHDSIVTFDSLDRVKTLQGNYFENAFLKTPPLKNLSESIAPFMSKQNVLDIAGLPAHANTTSNVWRYDQIHIIFNKNTGLVKAVLDFSRA